MSVIELNDVSVTFHEGGRTVEAVKHVNISVEKGEIFGIVGFSGAGKTGDSRIVDESGTFFYTTSFPVDCCFGSAV